VVHDEPDTIPAFPTSKALENVAGRGNVEGRRLFVVEWAKSGQIAPAAPKRYKILDYLLDTGPLQDFIYTFPADHEQ
jgi:hypothetical protein